MTDDKRPVLEVELAVWFGQRAIRHCLLEALPFPTRVFLRRQCAELLVPYHAPQAKIGFTCFIATLPRNSPAVLEAVLLRRHAADLHRIYGALARPMELTDAR